MKDVFDAFRKKLDAFTHDNESEKSSSSSHHQEEMLLSEVSKRDEDIVDAFLLSKSGGPTTLINVVIPQLDLKNPPKLFFYKLFKESKMSSRIGDLEYIITSVGYAPTAIRQEAERAKAFFEYNAEAKKYFPL